VTAEKRPARVTLIRRAKEYLDFLDIADFADEQAGDLSGGQHMLLQFARALMLKPRLMLLDEPFGGIHPLLIERILERIRDLRDQGIDFIVVTCRQSWASPRGSWCSPTAR